MVHLSHVDLLIKWHLQRNGWARWEQHFLQRDYSVIYNDLYDLKFWFSYLDKFRNSGLFLLPSPLYTYDLVVKIKIGKRSANRQVN